MSDPFSKPKMTEIQGDRDRPACPYHARYRVKCLTWPSLEQLDALSSIVRRLDAAHLDLATELPPLAKIIGVPVVVERQYCRRCRPEGLARLRPLAELGLYILAAFVLAGFVNYLIGLVT